MQFITNWCHISNVPTDMIDPSLKVTGSQGHLKAKVRYLNFLEFSPTFPNISFTASDKLHLNSYI